MYEYLQYPKSVRGLGEEIVRVFNDYYSRKIDTVQLRECVFSWAKNCPDKLFKATDLNPTVKKIIGKQRIELINKILEGYQIRLDAF